MSGIGSISSGYASAYSSGTSPAMRRPDAAQLAKDAFSRIDTEGKGYINESDFEQAVGQVGAPNGTRVSDVFKSMDGDGDGKVTQQEMEDNLKSMISQMEQRMASGGMPGMGSPGGAGAAGGLDRSQIDSMASSLSSVDPAASQQMQDLSANFDAADSNKDGTVSAQEALVYALTQQTTESSKPSSAASGSDDAAQTSSAESSSASSETLQAQLMQTIMRLAQSYGSIGSMGAGAGSTESASLLNAVA